MKMNFLSPLRVSICGAFCAMWLAAPAAAQNNAGQPNTPVNPTDVAAAASAALQLRSDLAAAIADGTKTTDEVLSQLQAQTSPSGLNLDHDADVGFAAIDVANRLLGYQKPAEAEILFRHAEASLAGVLQHTPDSDSWNKGQILQQLAVIRCLHLNNAVQARADIDAAIALIPDYPAFRDIRALLAKDHAAAFAAVPSNG